MFDTFTLHTEPTGAVTDSTAALWQTLRDMRDTLPTCAPDATIDLLALCEQQGWACIYCAGTLRHAACADTARPCAANASRDRFWNNVPGDGTRTYADGEVVAACHACNSNHGCRKRNISVRAVLDIAERLLR